MGHHCVTGGSELDGGSQARGLLAIAGALLIVVLTLIGAVAVQREREVDAEEAATTQAGAFAAAVADEVVESLGVARLFGTQVAGTPASVVSPPLRLTAGSIAVLQGRRLVPTTGTVDEAVVRSAEVAAAAGTARDTGRTVMAIPADGTIVAIVALYQRADGGLTTDATGPSTAQRRAASRSFVVSTLDTTAFVPNGRTILDVRDGAVRVIGTDAGDRPRISFPVRGRTWSVAVPATDVSVAPTAVAMALGGLLAGGLLVLLVSATGREAARNRTIIHARHAQAETFQRFAEVVQHSLDVADVLPAIAVLLRDDLGIAGLAVSTFEAGGGDRLLFTTGTAPDAQARPRAALPEVAETGQTLAVALRTGGRAVATARLRVGRPLDAIEVESLGAACELLTAALVNARAFERQEQAVQALRDLDELKTVFLGVASHELRTPVTAISGFAKMLNERWDAMPERQRQLLMSRIVANATALGSLVQDLLDFSRLERGRLVVATEPIDLAERVGAVLDRLAPIWDGREVNLEVRERPWVRGDVDGLERVVANLVSNAVKFSPDGAAVDVAVYADDGMGVLVVDDAGTGVPVEDREKIFSRFFRGAGPEVVRTRGAGIGLSVVKEFVDQMGGSIAVEDSPSGGARFEVRLVREEQRVDVEGGDGAST